MRRVGFGLGASVAVAIAAFVATASPARAGGNPPPAISPISATFDKPVTTYTVTATDTFDESLTYAWSHSKAEPCGQWSGESSRAYAWSHLHRAEGGDCNEGVHPAIVTVVVSDAFWSCTATYPKGSAPGTGDPPGPCIPKNIEGLDEATPAGPVDAAPREEPATGDDDDGGGSTGLMLGGIAVGVLVVGGTTILVVRRREDGQATDCDCGAILAALAEARERLARFRAALAGAEENVPASQAALDQAKAAYEAAKAGHSAGTVSPEDFDTAGQTLQASEEAAAGAPGLVETRKAELAKVEAEVATLEAEAKRCGCDGGGQTDTVVPASAEEPDGGLVGGLIEGLAGIGAPPAGGDHPRTVEKAPGEEYVQVTVGPEPEIPPTEPDEDRPWTIEERQAYIWEHWNGQYDPKGEWDFVTGARQDLANPDYDDDTKRIRRWIIEIYEEAYKYSRSQGYDNLVAHAYAHIKVAEWKDASLEQFEQAFGDHFANLGQELSGAALVNVGKFVTKAPTVAPAKFIPRQQLKGPAWVRGKTPKSPAPPKPVKPPAGQKPPAVQNPPNVPARPPGPPPPIGTWDHAAQEVIDIAKPLNVAPSVEKAAATAHRGVNCPYTSLVFAENFAGKGHTVSKVAPPFKVSGGIGLLETYFKGKFRPAQPQQIHAWLKAQPHGKQGVVYIHWKNPTGGPPTSSHVFNAVNHKGHVVFVDAQTGRMFNGWPNVDPAYTQFMPIP